jgi:hypothetical protein
MRRVGDEQFAVEYELDPPAGDASVDRWLNGRMCFVVGGVAIGDARRTISLNAATVAAKELLANRGRRSAPELMQEPAKSIFRIVFGALSEDTGQSDEQVASDWKKYSHLYGLARGLEVFDDWDAFLVEDAVQARYIWRHASKPESPVNEQVLRPGQFDDVLEAFIGEMRLAASDIVK